MTIQLSRREVLIFYVIVAGLDVLLIIANLINTNSSVVGFLSNQLDLRREANLGAWYSSVLLFIAGLASVFNALSSRPDEGRLGWIHRGGWLLVAAVFIAISGDEVAQIHEQLASLHNRRAMRTGGEIMKLGAGDWLPLLMPAIVISAVGMVAFFVFVFLKRRLSLVVSLAGIGCWIGAIYFESLESRDVQVFESFGTTAAIEESLEIVGTTLLIIAIVEFLRKRQSAAVA